MKNLRLKDSCLIDGQHAEAGSILKSVDNGIAADLVSSGRAIEITAEEAASGKVDKNGEPEVIRHGDPSSENRDPKVLGEQTEAGVVHVEKPTGGHVKDIKTLKDKPKA